MLQKTFSSTKANFSDITFTFSVSTVHIQATKERRMGTCRLLGLLLLLPLLLLLLPVLLPPILLHLQNYASLATAFLEHRLGGFPTSSSWEYIVVGAGSGGSVVAGRLAEAGNR